MKSNKILLLVLGCMVLATAHPILANNSTATMLVTETSSKENNPFLERDFWKTLPSIEVLKEKLKEGHSITDTNSNGFDAVTFAIFADNSLETIQFLIEQGNDVNKLTHDSRTYIFWAAYQGNLPLMKYFVKIGAKLDLLDSHGYTVLLFTAAAGQKDTAIYDYIIELGADVTKEKDHDGGNVLLVAAGRAKSYAIIDYFVSKGVDLNTTDDHGNGVFHAAASGGNLEILKQLVKKGVNTKANPKTGENAIYFATTGRGNKNGVKVFEYLESLGLSANVTTKKGTTPLHNIARSSANISLYTYFINNGVDVNAVDAKGNNALLFASSRNKIEVVAFLEDKIKDINDSNIAGKTALSNAVEGNNVAVINYLLSKNANTFVLDKKGNSLAYYLIKSFNTRNAKSFSSKLSTLVKAGVDFKKLQADNKTIYHLAIDKNNVGLLKDISTLGVAINAKDSQGNTALHYAAMNANNTVVLKFLLENGADEKATTEFGETAYDLAKENELLQNNSINLAFLK